jgi:hypothetical protein
MKFDEAMRAANRAGRAFLKKQVMPCPFMNTGLLVVVYREDDQAVIPDAKAVIKGEGRVYAEERVGKGKPPRYHRTDVDIDNFATTDGNGIARFLPCNPGQYAVSAVADLADVVGKSAEVSQRVPAQECPICLVAVPAWARPEIEVLGFHDSKGVAGVTVALGEKHSFPGATDSVGLSVWKGDPVEPGHYTVALTFAKGGNRIFDAQKTLAKAPAIDLPPGKKRFTFYVQRLSWVKLEVLRVKPEGDPEPLQGAKVTAQLPGEQAETTLQIEGVPKEVKDIPMVDGPDTKVTVISLEAPDDGDPWVYELVEASSA